MTKVCAWCKKVLSWGPEPVRDFATKEVSHGICSGCRKNVVRDLVWILERKEGREDVCETEFPHKESFGECR